LRRLATHLLIVISVVTLLSAILLPLAVSASTSTSARAVASWTFMVYLDGDNNLESFGIEDFLEMSSVGSTAQVNIVVQFDRSPLSDWSGGSSDYGDWTTTKRFLVERGDDPTSSNQLSDLGEANMGAKATLQSFLEWGMGSYPANNYALVLWDHGGGWVYGVCSDDTSSGDSLLLPEIREAISAAESSTGKRVGLVGFDACLMGMTEVAFELKELTDVVVFSEETEPGQGWAYDKVLRSLTSQPAMSPSQLGSVIVSEYSKYYGSSGKETLSSVSTMAMDQLCDSLTAFASELTSSFVANSAQIRQARSNSEHFEYEMFIDLYDFASKARSAGGSGLAGAADQVMRDINAAVLSETSGNERPGAHGLAIYFPDVVSDLNLVGYRSDASITKNCTWDEFLDVYFNGASGGGSDEFEEDGTYQQAKQIFLGIPQYHSINGGGADLDWVYFTLTNDSDVVVQTAGVSGDTEISLYSEANVTGAPLAYDDDSGVGYFSRILAHLPAGKYYVKVGEYGGDAEIATYQLRVSIPSAQDAYEPDDSPEEASTLMPGVPQLHSIGDGGADKDWAEFSLSATQNVIVETWGPQGDTRIWMYVSEGGNLNEVASDDDTGAGLFSMIMLTGLAPGQYFVMVEDYYNDQEIPSYYLNLTYFSMDDEYEPDNTYQQATALGVGEVQWHSIGDEGDDVDWYRIDLALSSDVALETFGPMGDTQIFLYSSAGVPSDYLESDDDSGVGYFSLIQLEDLSAGTYYLKVQAYHDFYFFGAEPVPRYGIRWLTEPSPPTSFMAQLQGSNVLLTWSPPPSDGGSPVDHYEVLRSSLAGQELFYRSVAGTSFIDSNTSSGADLYYEVRAVTQFGKGALSAEEHVKIPGEMVVPGAITSIGVEAHADRIVLSWQQPATGGGPIIAYHVMCAQEADGSDRMEIGTTTTTRYVDDGVVEGGTYYYWVVAENGNGLGQMSAVAQATAEDPGMTAATILLLVLSAIGIMVALVVIILLLAVRGKRKRGGPEAPNPAVRCPTCGSTTLGHPYCGNCGRRLY
jgi:hypothetical protein